MSFTVEVFLYFITNANQIPTENTKVSDLVDRTLVLLFILGI